MAQADRVPHDDAILAAACAPAPPAAASRVGKTVVRHLESSIEVVGTATAARARCRMIAFPHPALTRVRPTSSAS